MINLIKERQMMDKVIESMRVKEEKLGKDKLENRLIAERIAELRRRILFINRELTEITIYADKISPCKELETTTKTSNTP